MKKKKIGRPALGGIRVQVRFRDESQLKLLDDKLEILNKKAKFGESIDRSGFIVKAVVEYMKKVK